VELAEVGEELREAVAEERRAPSVTDAERCSIYCNKGFSNVAHISRLATLLALALMRVTAEEAAVTAGEAEEAAGEALETLVHRAKLGRCTSTFSFGLKR
jgi:hypothetical protein